MNLSDSKLLDIIQSKESSWVLHENANLLDVTLAPRHLHSVNGGYEGVKHFGGCALAKRIKQNVGDENFERYITYVSEGAFAN